MSNAFGVDVSFYQDDDATAQRIDFNKMKAAGAEFVIIRAGQNLWPDPDFKDGWSRAKLAGLPRASYFYFDSRVSPESQAQLYIDMHDGDFGELPLFPDFEENYGGLYSSWLNWKAFLEYLKARVGGHEIGLYTRKTYFEPKVPASDRLYFKQYPLWVAHYGAATPWIPDPWTTYLFWQTESNEYNTDGAKFGVESKGIDKNVFNGDTAAFRQRFNLPEVPAPTPSEEIHRITHDGIEFHKVVRYGCNCFVMVVDTTKARLFVAPGFRTVSQAIAAYPGAVAGTNGGGWANESPNNLNEITASDGQILQATAKDGRSSINIRKDGVVEIKEPTTLSGLWNAYGFDRILGRPSTGFNTKISDLYTKDARTGSGYRADGKLVMLVAEGNDAYQLGLTFKEMWDVLSEFGAIYAGNNDGGSSSQMVNLGISPTSLNKGSDGHDATVKTCVLLFADPNGGGNLPPPPPSGGTMRIKILSTIRKRDKPSFYGNGKGDAYAGQEYDVLSTSITKESIGSYPVKDIMWAKLSDGTYVPEEYYANSTMIWQDITSSPPPPSTVVKTHTIEVFSDGSIKVDGNVI